MYASLISAGASTLLDLVKSATSSSSAAAANTAAPAFPDDTATPSTTPASTVSPVNAAGDTGAKVSDAVHKLFVDLQAGTDATGGTPPTGTDGRSLRKAVGAAHPHGAHAAHGHANPLSTVAAYAKTQALGTSAATALAA